MKEINKIRNTKISKIQRERLTWINYKTIEHEEATTGGVLQKKGVLRNFAKIHGKTPMPESLI